MKKLKIYRVLASGLVCSVMLTSINYPVYAEKDANIYYENEIVDPNEDEVGQTIIQHDETEFDSDLKEALENEESESSDKEDSDETGEKASDSESNENVENEDVIESPEDEESESFSDSNNDLEKEEIIEDESEIESEENQNIEDSLDPDNETSNIVETKALLPMSGKCGTNVTYKLYGNSEDGYKLTLSGTGDMYDIRELDYKTIPWYSIRKEIKELYIEEGITSITTHAFYQCQNIENDLVIPSTVTKIRSSAFYGCHKITGDLVLPSGLTFVGDLAFCQCYKLSGTLNIPSSLRQIGRSAFSRSGIEGTLIIPDTVQSIQPNAFSDCNGLTRIINNCGQEITLPSEDNTWWIQLGDAEGAHITSLTSGTAIKMPMKIIVDNITYKVISNATASENGTVELIDGSKYVSTNLSIPDVITDEDGNLYDVITIAAEAFKDCDHITGTITLPSTLKTIGDSVFWGCKGLTGDLVIPDGVTTIGADAFWDCENLNGTLSLPNSLTSLGDSAFEHCEKLSGTLSIPTGLDAIPENAFAFDSGFSGTLEIPENIKSIGGSAFEGCTGITDLIIKSVSDGIDDYAFGNCSGLNKVRISSNVNSIGEQVFYDFEKECNLNIIIYADESSYAYKWAADNGFYCVNTELWDNQIYEILFESDGDSITYNTKLVVNNSIYGSLPQATKINYDFLGWYTSDNNEITPDSVVNLSENQTLYSKWRETKGFEFTEETKDSRLKNARGCINISLKKTSYAYTGSEIQPAITVNYVYQEYNTNGSLGKSQKQKLVQNVDYTISYENNVNVSGDHKIIITGIGDYYGEITKTFTIEPKSAKKLTIEPIADQSGTYEEISANINDIVIVRDDLLTVDPSNYDINVSQSAANVTVTIAAKGNYTGAAPKAKATFNLVDINNKQNASNLVLTVKSKTLTYSGKAQKPKVTVTDAAGNKVNSKNYKLIYTNNINAGMGTVYAVGKNDYYGTSNPVTFKINPKDFKKVKITKLSKIMFRSSVDDIHPIIKDGKNILKEGVDYNVTFDVSSGLNLFGIKSKKITVTVHNLSSNYTDATQSTSLVITPRNIKSTLMCVITVDQSEGSSNRPSVTVKYSGKILKEGEDYTLSYSGNAMKGTVKVTGTGNYTGKRTVKYINN